MSEKSENIFVQNRPFEIPFDVVTLPSRGLVYPHKISQLEVEYMTASDENILTSPNLIRSGKHIDTLLSKKIKTKGIKPELLLPGDRNAIINFLRYTAYGGDYSVRVYDPETGLEFEDVVDLTKLGEKVLTEIPDDNFLFTFVAPIRKHTIKFKLLTSFDYDNLQKNAERMATERKDNISEILTLRLKAMIQSVEGNVDKIYISQYVDSMSPKDSLELRRYVEKIEPNLDLSYEFKSPFSGKFFRSDITLGIDYLLPDIK
jgi:hypothetical protein